jgi:acetyl-CoA carboxylase carboxyl transferase subunit alpha
MLIGHQKGRDTKERVRRNYGMPKPEGYRKALRLMKMAERFRVPVITLIDTPGAYPGIGSEERGQSEAIARNLFEMSNLAAPVLSVVIGEGGSGGALAIGVCDHLLMLQRLFGHHAGSLRVDFVEEHGEERDRCRCHGRHGGTALQARAGR